ncbi:hypothetical protein [Streptomyces sp. NPDC000983]|uniref:hypothetical protein n=1 Tax=Streptomyces sp. NPDC000983 TaxID=3154373 RepID=UPI00332C7292
MSGGIPPLRDRHLAAGFIVVMYLMVAALLAGITVSAFSDSGVAVGSAACAGGVLGAAAGVWRVHRTPEEERADEGTP